MKYIFVFAILLKTTNIMVDISFPVFNFKFMTNVFQFTSSLITVFVLDIW